jgi:hypothetical protein
MERFHCYLVKWEDIERWSRDVSLKLESSGYEPDLVVGLARGGWVPARLICDHLLIKNLCSLRTEHWGITATPDGEARLAQPLGIEIAGKKVLVVDDITDTGKSLAIAMDHLKGGAPLELRVATLLRIQSAKVVPDYYSEMVPKDRWTWFIFPWNRDEDFYSLVPKALYEPGDREQIGKRLQEQFDIDAGEDMVARALSLLQRYGKISSSFKDGRELFALSG